MQATALTMNAVPFQPMAQANAKLHIVMFPWLAFGHMIPYLELAKLIAQRGHQVSFISTPRNIDRLPKLPPNLAPLINLVKLPLPHVKNLPENAEATSDVPYDKVQYLKKAYDGLQQPMLQFLRTSSPDWVLYDFVSYWLGPEAAKLGIPSAFFSIFIAALLAFFEPTSDLMSGQEDRREPKHYTVPPKWVNFPSKVAYKYFEIKRIFVGMEGDSSGVSFPYRLRETARGCDVVLVRSCSKFEPEWLQLLEKMHQKTVIPVGQLPTTVYYSEEDVDDAWLPMKEWLDKQEKGSVVYVAFGSEAKPSQEELTELALGLELSGLPFFWVLRKRHAVFDTEVVELPEGFEERTKDSGVVCTSWAPQLKILSHDSIGGLLTHSGWSSVVEALQLERALIMLTFLADQGINARILEEKKIAYPIPRDDRDGSFTRDSVAKSLRLVMVEEEGKIYREKAKEMKELFGDKDLQDRYVDNLLGYLLAYKHLHKEPDRDANK